MPRTAAPLQRADAESTALLNGLGAARLAIGWHVARQAGITPPLHPLVGSEVVARWSGAGRKPDGLSDFEPMGRLYYRIRAACLALNGHPYAALCGGAERWWQRILDEQLLALIYDAVVVPQSGGAVARRHRPRLIWWARHGINPCSIELEPATWALLDALQSRVYPSRSAEATHLTPALPYQNGERSLHQCRQLLTRYTGRDAGWAMLTGREITRDWLALLAAWEALIPQEPTKAKGQRNNRRRTLRETRPLLTVEQLHRQHVVAIALANTLLPEITTSIAHLRGQLHQFHSEKPSNDAGSQPQIENTAAPLPKGCHSPPTKAKLSLSAEKIAGGGANQARNPY